MARVQRKSCVHQSVHCQLLFFFSPAAAAAAAAGGERREEVRSGDAMRCDDSAQEERQRPTEYYSR